MKQIVQKIVLSMVFLATLHASNVRAQSNLDLVTSQDNKEIASKIGDIIDAYRDSKALKELKKTLKNSSFDLNTPLNGDSTALNQASKYGYLKVAKWLVIDKDVNVNTKNNLGFTPLHLAILSGNNALELVKLLVEHGAKIDAENMQKETALHLSANKDTELMCYLLDHGANIEAKTNNGKTVLDLAAEPFEEGLRSAYNSKLEQRKLENLKCLIGHGANINPEAIKLAYTSEMKKYLQVAQNKKPFDAKLK